MNPTDREALTQLGAVLLAMGRELEFLWFAEKLVEAEPEWAMGYLYKATAHYNMNDYDAAMHAALRATELEPENVPALRVLALASVQVDRKERPPKLNPILIAKRAVTADPLDADSHYCLGSVVARYPLGGKTARNALQEALRLNPDHSMATLELGVLLQRKMRYARALEMYVRGESLLARHYISMLALAVSWRMLLASVVIWKVIGMNPQALQANLLLRVLVAVLAMAVLAYPGVLWRRCDSLSRAAVREVLGRFGLPQCIYVLTAWFTGATVMAVLQPSSLVGHHIPGGQILDTGGMILLIIAGIGAFLGFIARNRAT